MNAVARPVPFAHPARRAPSLRALRKQCGALASWVPFTGAFRRHVEKTVAARMQQFHALADIPQEAREEIARRVEDAERKVARLSLRHRAVVSVTVALSAVVLLYYSIFQIPEYLVALRQPYLVELQEHWLVVTGAAVACLIAAGMAAMALHHFLRERFGGGDARLSMVLLALVVLTGLVAIAQAVVNAWSLAYVSPFVALAALAVCWFVSVAVTAGATWLVVNQAGKLYRARSAAAWPEDTAIHQFVSVLARVRNEEGSCWFDLDHRRELLHRLECAATCIECYLPRRLGEADASTGSWLRQRTRGIAESLRELKRDVSLPQQQARDRVAERISATLVHAARGDWRLLEGADRPVIEEEKPVRRLRWWEVALRGAALLVVGAAVLWKGGGAVQVADHVMDSLNGLLGPLVVPAVAYGLLRTVNPAILENLASIRSLGGEKK